MSLNGAMLSGVSALTANSSALGAVSDNISNVNTIGYKQNVGEFEDMVTSPQAGAAVYNSGGVQANVADLINQQGQFQQTQTSTNMAINGQGLFVVSGTSAGLSATSAPSFTRAGDFSADKNGFLVNSSGFYLLGWPANAAGVVTPNPSQLTSLSPINVNQIQTAPTPSTQATLNANLDSQLYAPGAASTPVTNGTYSPTSATTSMAAYDAGIASGTPPDYSTQVTMYDSQGGSHTLQFDFLKLQAANTWQVEINMVPSTDTTAANGQLAQGTVTFNSAGAFQTTTLPTTGLPANGDINLTIPWVASSGLSTQSLNVLFNSSSGALTQYATASTTNSATVDGGPASSVSGIKVTTAGIVQASFANGTQKTIAQVAVATFPNPDGLTPASGTSFNQSNSSGIFTLNQPQHGGAGEIESSNLESSTVDLSTQFTNLIQTQNAYNAASKIITTADNMYQVIDNIIH